MLNRASLITLLAISLGGCATRRAATTHEVDLAGHFAGYDGCFVMLDVGRRVYVRYNPLRCDERLSPCSTFKIPNALIGLETGVVSGAGHTIRWDGHRHRREALNRDHDLRSAIQNSVVWYFQAVASEVGEERMAEALASLNYGNRDISGGLTQFWLEDSLKISANEQVRFLQRLYLGTLPFSKRSQAIVRNILVQYKDDTGVLRGKTGSGRAGIGWFVGYLERPDDVFIFAANITGEHGAWGGKARKICLSVLRELVGDRGLPGVEGASVAQR